MPSKLQIKTQSFYRGNNSRSVLHMRERSCTLASNAASGGTRKARGSCHLQRLCSLLFYELANLAVAQTVRGLWRCNSVEKRRGAASVHAKYSGETRENASSASRRENAGEKQGCITAVAEGFRLISYDFYFNGIFILELLSEVFNPRRMQKFRWHKEIN